MRVIDEGHLYELDELDGGNIVVLPFVKRVGVNYPGNKSPAHPGTTTQEVMSAVANRLRYVNKQRPCLETEMAISLAEHIIVLLEQRNARIKGRSLQATHIEQVIVATTCPLCLHIECHEHQQDHAP